MSYELLNRQNIFIDLIRQIEDSQKVIVFDAYIWIDDEVGNDVSRACVDAANRGVKVFIRHDSTASVFEHTPGRMPMFFDNELLDSKKSKSFKSEYGFLTPKTFNTLAHYIYEKQQRPVLKQKSPLVAEIENNGNIFLHNKPIFNHGKLILIDDVAYVGGQCISKDYKIWTDYNVKIHDTLIVEDIWKKVIGVDPYPNDRETIFIDNVIPKSGSGRKKSIHYFLKEFIETAENELIIEMAYLGKWYVPILKRALKRGTKVTLLVTKENCDTNHNTNMWVLAKLLKTKSENLRILFYKGNMIHTKGLVTKDKVTLGSANFHSACGYFYGLNEQNIFSTNKKLVNDVYSQFERDCLESEEAVSINHLPKWSKSKALIEITFVFITGYITFFYRKKVNKWRSEVNEGLEQFIPSKD